MNALVLQEYCNSIASIKKVLINQMLMVPHYFRRQSKKFLCKLLFSKEMTPRELFVYTVKMTKINTIDFSRLAFYFARDFGFARSISLISEVMLIMDASCRPDNRTGTRKDSLSGTSAGSGWLGDSTEEVDIVTAPWRQVGNAQGASIIGNLTPASPQRYSGPACTQLQAGFSPPFWSVERRNRGAFFVPACLWQADYRAPRRAVAPAVGLTCFRSATLFSPSSADFNNHWSTAMKALVTPEIRLENGHPVTTSIALSQFFGKQHKNVIRNIDNLECSKEFTELNFEPSEYADSTGRQLPCYLITRDGFTFLAMGFTGKTPIGKVHCPRFEEWMMAWPETWGALTGFEMDKYQSWLQAHGMCSPAAEHAA